MIKLKTLVQEVYNANLLENEGNYKIFCDLDGVLVDFDKSVKQLTGGIGFDEYVKLKGHSELWKMINSHGSMWWETLPWKEDGKVLWNFLKNKDITILTAGSRRNTGDIAEKGKKEWCFKNLGADIKVIVTASSKDKQQHAKPNYILVDDLESNIQEWNNAGGTGILHRNSAQSINVLRKIFTNNPV